MDIQGADIGKDYKIYYTQTLGKGAYGEVYKGFSRSRKCIVAIKKLNGSAEQIWKQQPTLKREVEVMGKFNHENIMKLFDYIENENGIYIITQYCDGGDLKNQIKNASNGISQKTTMSYFSQIVHGMAQVNRQKCFHRDLKPQNIMLNQDGTIKIGDFGLARQIIGDDINKLKIYTAKGTPVYAAPNILKAMPFSGLCDVWSLGLILHQMLTGKNLFASCKNMFALGKQHEKMKGKIFELEGNYSKFFKQCLAKMLAYDETDRIGFSQLEDIIKQNNIQMLDLGLKNIEKQNSAMQIQIPNTSLIVPKEKINEIKQVESQITEKSKKGMIKIKPKIYQQNKNQTFNNQGTVANMTELAIQQQNYHLTLQLFKYTDFLYNRGALYTETIIRLKTELTYPLDGGRRYLLLFLQICLFLKSIEQIEELLHREKVVLPNGVVIISKNMDKNSQVKYREYAIQYAEKLKDDNLKYIKTLTLIKDKLYSPQYEKYNNLKQQYKSLYDSLLVSTVNYKLESRQFYQNAYKEFIQKECRLKSSKEKHLRIYNILLSNINLPKTLPESRFNEQDIVHRFREDYDKITYENLIERIKLEQAKL